MSTAIVMPVELADAIGGARRGIALLKQGQAKESIPCFRGYLEVNPECADAWNNLGVTFYEVDDFHAAANCYRRALALRPDFAGAHVNRGTPCGD